MILWVFEIHLGRIDLRGGFIKGNSTDNALSGKGREADFSNTAEEHISFCMVNILVDSCVFHHANIFKGERQSHGEVLWGGVVPVDTGILQSREHSVPVKESKGGNQSRAIATLANLFKRQRLNAFTTDALEYERFPHNQEKYRPKNYGDASLFDGVTFKRVNTLDGFMHPLLLDDPSSRLREYLVGQSKNDLIYKAILDALNSVSTSDKNSQDAWHLVSSSRIPTDYFLTTDTTLIGQISSIRNSEMREWLLSFCLRPTEVCRSLNISPMPEEDFIAFKNSIALLPDTKPK